MCASLDQRLTASKKTIRASTAELINLDELRANLVQQTTDFDAAKHQLAEIERTNETILARLTQINVHDANRAAIISGHVNEVNGTAKMNDLTTYRLDQADKRAEAIEARMGRLEGKMHGIDIRLRAVETKLSEISGQLTLLVGKIPSWWQPPVSAAGLVALLVGALGVLKSFQNICAMTSAPTLPFVSLFG